MLNTLTAESSCYTALLELEALGNGLSRGSAGDMIAAYLNDRLSNLTRTLEYLKWMNPTKGMAELSDRYRKAFVVIQSFCSTCCARMKVAARHCFRKIGNILFCLFVRGTTPHLTPTATLNIREGEPAFRVALIDRLTDYLREMFAWLRTLARACEATDGMTKGPVVLGRSAARFVMQADTSTGVLVMRFQDGHQELFNLTESQWALILPLLTTTHESGHAKLAKRPQSLLTRHDANGDELEGDLWRLKRYIHPAGRGRGGNGLYFLAPYPRQVNTVDRQ